MTGGSALRVRTEDDDTFDLVLSDSPLIRRRQRYRTGSLSAECQSFPGLRHSVKGPASPKEAAQENTVPDLGMLIRYVLSNASQPSRLFLTCPFTFLFLSSIIGIY